MTLHSNTRNLSRKLVEAFALPSTPSGEAMDELKVYSPIKEMKMSATVFLKEADELRRMERMVVLRGFGVNYFANLAKVSQVSNEIMTPKINARMAEKIVAFSSLVARNEVRAVALILTAEEMRTKIQAERVAAVAGTVLESVVEKSRVRNGIPNRKPLRRG
jgi:hypothetical protein